MHLVWDTNSGASREGLGTEWVTSTDASMQGHPEGSRDSSACGGTAPTFQPCHHSLLSAVFLQRTGAVVGACTSWDFPCTLSPSSRVLLTGIPVPLAQSGAVSMAALAGVPYVLVKAFHGERKVHSSTEARFGQGQALPRRKDGQDVGGFIMLLVR